MKNFTYKNEHKLNVVTDFGFHVYAKSIFDIKKNDTKTVFYIRSAIEANAWHVEAITTNVNAYNENVVEIKLGEANNVKHTTSVQTIELRKNNVMVVKNMMYTKNEFNNFSATKEHIYESWL